MSDSDTLAPVTVTVSARAAKRINAVMAKEASGRMLRLSVSGGGCSGFQYIFDIVGDRESDDLVIERDGATVLVDSVSLDFLKGAEIDFADDLMGQAFRVNNPNATASCGCGTSFTV